MTRNSYVTMDTQPFSAPLSKRNITILIGILLFVCFSIIIIFLWGLTSGTPSVSSGSEWTLESYADATGSTGPGHNWFRNYCTVWQRCKYHRSIWLQSVCRCIPCERKPDCDNLSDFNQNLLVPKPGIMQQENAYLLDLSQATSVQQNAGEMKLLDKNKKTILTFRPK